MCGGYSLTKNLKKTAVRLGINDDTLNFAPRYNARPAQNMPVILNSDPNHFQFAHWGITPFWAKKESKKIQLINTRIESADKITFKKDFSERRCLIPADGFFEWEKTSSGKQPHYFRLKSKEIFSFAGIWEEDDILRIPTFTILTMEPNGLVKKIHNRMPVILNPEMESEWLTSKTDVHDLIKNISPFPEDDMEEIIVSRKVNNAVNDFPELLNPV